MITSTKNDAIEKRGQALYETRLRAELEPTHAGEAVAIHLPTGDYTVHRSRSRAVCELFERHNGDGEIYAQVIGAPTVAETMLAALLTGGKP